MTPAATSKHLFYAELAKLLEAGFDIRKAAKVLEDTQLPAAQGALLKNLHRGLESGESIADAFSRDNRTISGLERGIIDAGERGGQLAAAFQHLADYFGMLAAARRRITTGMIYPIIILHLGVVIGTVPTALMHGEAPARMLASVAVNLLIIYSALLAAFFLIRGALALSLENKTVDAAINRIPWIGRTRRNFAMARFTTVYHSCLLAGIPMSSTVALSADASHSGLIRAAGGRLEATAREGNPLGPVFVAETAFPKAFARTYQTGEQAGTLDKDLARWSRVFRDDSESSAREMATAVPKLLYFIILLFVAWKIIGFFNGYYGDMERMME